MLNIMIEGTLYTFHRSSHCPYSDKFNRMVKLATKFEELSMKFDGMILRGNGDSQTARLALACKMLMYTGIRIGNEDSAEGYMTKPHPNSKKLPEFVQTYGLTTLLPEHCEVTKKGVLLNFLGKKQVENSFFVSGLLGDQLKTLLGNSQQGETLFEISVRELTKFIKKSVGKQFTPKDFRTLRANMCASECIDELLTRPYPRNKSERNGEYREILNYVSDKLNNTPGVCKVSYIDKKVWSYVETNRPIVKQ